MTPTNNNSNRSNQDDARTNRKEASPERQRQPGQQDVRNRNQENLRHASQKRTPEELRNKGNEHSQRYPMHTFI